MYRSGTFVANIDLHAPPQYCTRQTVSPRSPLSLRLDQVCPDILASRVSADGPKVRAVTVIPKLCLRAILDFGIFSPPLQLLHLMANTTLVNSPKYLPKKDAPTGLSLCGLCGHVFSHGGPALLHMALQKHRLHLSSTLSMRAKPSAPEQQYELRHT